ncbi:MAG: hypothetical protein HOI23_10355 [Deltaproteobacteria bacterium]|jgi:hypothetical protein|nr:hypothetical protein [Deltaproteobacteria bacterium]
MMRHFKSICTVLVLIGMAGQAHAYVLPAEYIMRMLADKISRLKVEDVSIKLESQQGSETVAERFYLKRAERSRLLSGADQALIYLENEGQVADTTSGSFKKSSNNQTDVLTALLFPKGKNLDERALRMLDVLSAAGVDTSVVALGRSGNRPVYIVGAKAFEPLKPQVWLDKQSFVLVRSVLYSAAGSAGDKVEKRYLDHQKSAAGKWFPSTIETWKNDILVKEQAVVEAKKNQKLPESMFRLP